MRFSVVIPVYNKAEFISDAIESILNQAVKDFEIIVVDDGSSDEIDSVLSKYSDIKLVRQENSGVSVARNTGINAACGDYICFLDADDKWLPNHLKILDGLINKYPEESYFVTSHITTAPDGKEYGSSKHLSGMQEDFICENLFKLLNERSDGIIHTNSICIKKSVIARHNIYFEPGERIGEDTDMWFRVSLYCPLVISKAETTVYRRENSTATKNTTNTLNWIFARRIDDILKMNISQDVKDECVKLIDRYKMTCSRDYLLSHNRKDALKILKTVKHKTKKFYISQLFCYMPYKLFEFIFKHIF